MNKTDIPESAGGDKKEEAWSVLIGMTGKYMCLIIRLLWKRQILDKTYYI